MNIRLTSPQSDDSLCQSEFLEVLSRAACRHPRTELADKNFALLQADPAHPSLHFKKVGRFRSVRVGLQYRTLAVDVEDGLLWFWVGDHAEYERLIDG